MAVKNHENNWKWLEIIRRPPREKGETPTERVRRELETAIALRHEAMKSAEVDKLVPKLRLMIADEQMGIQDYEEMHKLFNKISFATGMLEAETRALKEILEDERKHKRELERILDELTR